VSTPEEELEQTARELAERLAAQMREHDPAKEKAFEDAEAAREEVLGELLEEHVQALERTNPTQDT
jgi:hypothetical protein